LQALKMITSTYVLIPDHEKLMSPTTATLGEFEDWEVLSSFLPAGWVEFMYRQVRMALMLPRSPATVLRRWHAITRLMADTPRTRSRHPVLLG